MDKLSEALVKAQAAIQPPVKDCEADTGRYTYGYASLGAVRDAVIPVMNAHGLAILQSPGTSERGPTLTTLIVHQGGQWLELEALTIPVARPDAQAYGSAISYMRRYALLAIAGVVAEEDDDGREASRPPLPEARPREAMATAEQITRLDQLLLDLKVTREQYEACLEEWKVRGPEYLSSSRLASILEKLEAKLEKQSAPPPASARGTSRAGRDRGG